MRSRAASVAVKRADGSVVALAVDARRPLQRMRGLIGSQIASGDGLLLRGCSSIHTNFMGYPIDVIYLSHDSSIVKLATDVRPWRFSWGGAGARDTLELPAGEVRRLGLRVGERLAMGEISDRKAG